MAEQKRINISGKWDFSQNSLDLKTKTWERL